MCVKGWGRMERLRRLLWKQSRMTIGAIRKELAFYIGDMTAAERPEDKGTFRAWFEQWRTVQYNTHFESVIGYKRAARLKAEERRLREEMLKNSG